MTDYLFVRILRRLDGMLREQQALIMFLYEPDVNQTSSA